MDTKQRRKIIGLYSPAPQSGKTTVANFLVDHFEFQRRSIATPLKNMVHSLLYRIGLDRGVVEYLKNEGKEVPIPRLGNKSYRELCQTLGVDWGRKLVDDDLWLKIALEVCDEPLVIDDVRFPNEYRAIIARGGEMWKVTRDGAKLPNNHTSEGLLEGLQFNRHLTNNGSKQELFSQLIFKEN